MLSDQQKGELKAPLNANLVKKNPKGFDYIEGWHAIAEANRIFGHDGWSREVVSMVLVGAPYQDAKSNWRVGYRATVRVRVEADGLQIVRDGTGYGSGIVKDLNDAHEGAVKEAETDAMKRALMTFGNPFGLALYDKDRTNVETPPPASVTAMLDGLRDAARDGDIAMAAYWKQHWPAVPADWRPHVLAEKENIKAGMAAVNAVRSG